MRVLVTGGRHFDNVVLVNTTLDAIDVSILGHGACPYGGADILAENWAKSREIDYQGFPAKFNRDGRMAGPQRNQCMLATFKPDLVVAFKGGRGTANTIEQAQKLGIDVRIIS